MSALRPPSTAPPGAVATGTAPTTGPAATSAAATATAAASPFADPPRRGRPPMRNEILRAGRLGGVLPDELARRFGTPLYAYDLDVVDRQVAALRSVLPSRFELAYAVKANPALAMVAHLGALGLGADVASAGELATVRRAGIDPSRVVFTGPGKREDEIRAAVESGVRVITIESPGEFERLERIAAESAANRATGRRVAVLLRAAVSPAARLERVRLVGDDGAGKFGMDADDLLAVARRAVRSPYVELLGLHAFGASNVLDAAALAGHIESTVATACLLARTVGFPLRLVDAGGGLGIPYEAHEESLDLVGFGRRLARLAERWSEDPVLRDTRILLEPGRYLVGTAGAYLACVVDRKQVDGSTVVVLDGGVHHLLRPALVGQEHRIRLVSRRSATPGSRSDLGGKAIPVTVAGPLCSGLDVLAAGAIMPVPDPGDLVAVLDVGAYGFTESMPWFLSHPVPAEVAIRAGRAELIRPRLEPASWLATQRLPEW